ncbi:pyrroloquinoline quinone biosynthesis protein PqqF [Erwinia sp. CPCC 100877]|nr:pyrroloquinoline quinone biosynthesis protein PqqF [Erwinia sp. CPCC 100877]
MIIRRLANGLRVHAITQPQARRAAALVRIETGSNHEPRTWPGLAHLLEHTLFAESSRYRDQQRLMPWVQRQGGQLNATTRDEQTAFFFEVGPDRLAEGLERLLDMLAAPTFSLAAIQAETAAIDAEYGLLKRHGETLREAATLLACDGSPTLHRFRVGSRAAFGEDPRPLQSALRAFHQRHYRAGRMSLWLQGPQSEEALMALSAPWAQLPDGAEPLPATVPLSVSPRRMALRLTEAPRLRLAFTVENQPASAGVAALLQAFVEDEAPGGLAQALGEYAPGGRPELRLVLENPHVLVLAIDLPCGEAPPDSIAALFFDWLAQLRRQHPAIARHYAALARRDFDTRSPLEQLHARAMLPGEAACSEAWRPLLQALTPDRTLYLYSAPHISGQIVNSQGFSLEMGDYPTVATAAPTANWRFMDGNCPTSPTPPKPQVELTRLTWQGETTLLLGARLLPEQGLALQLICAPLTAACRHYGGVMRFDNIGGEWLLALGGSPQVMEWALAGALDAFRQMTPEAWRRGGTAHARHRQQLMGEIALRALMAQLPALLEVPEDKPRWRAALMGGNTRLHQRLAQRLSRLPWPLVRDETPASSTSGHHYLPAPSNEAALLLFCPAPVPASENAMRILALILAPDYFRRMRDELEVGYAVNCRFHQSAGRCGLLFMVQSARFSAQALLEITRTFLESAQPRIVTLPLKELASLAAASAEQPPETPIIQAALAWQAHRRRAYTNDAVITPGTLHSLYRQILAGPERWLVVQNPQDCGVV